MVTSLLHLKNEDKSKNELTYHLCCVNKSNLLNLQKYDFTYYTVYLKYC